MMKKTCLGLILAWLLCLSAHAGDAPKPLTLMDAVSTAVSNAYDVVIAKETVKYKEAQVRIDKGEQDIEVTTEVTFESDETHLTPYSQAIYRKSAEDTQTLTSTIEAEKKLQSGITLTSGLSLEREDDDLQLSPPDNTSEVYFKVTLPVLKLWKSGLKIGKIKNSEIDLDASRKDLAATVSSSIETVANAFWDALAQKKMLAIYQALEADTRTFLSEMTLMVEKKEYPAANLDTIRADLKAKSVTRIAAEQSYFEALQTLALDMGVAAERLAEVLDVAGDFPKTGPNRTGLPDLIRLARDSRPDLLADKIRIDYYKALLADAEEGLLPDLDFSLKGGYKGLDESATGGSYLESAKRDVPGPSYAVGVSYTIPIGNNVAGGEYAQARISLAKEELAFQNLLRTVTSEVLTANQALSQSLAALKLQKEAVATYKSALEKETLRFRLQMASLSDQMDARDNYYGSLNTLVSKQLAYAKALAGFHQACGTLVAQEGEDFRIREAALFSPAIDLRHP